MDDEKMIRLLSRDQNESEAAKMLLKAFPGRLRAVMAAKKLYLWEDAMAYAGDVWLKLRMSAPSFRGYGAPGAATAWINRLIYCTVIDSIRKDRPTFSTNSSSGTRTNSKEKGELVPRFQNYSDEEWDQIASTHGQEDPAPGFATHQDHELYALYSGIADFEKDHPQKATLLLYRLEDMSYEQIALELGTKASTLRQANKSATKLLVPYVMKQFEIRHESANEPNIQHSDINPQN